MTRLTLFVALFLVAHVASFTVLPLQGASVVTSSKSRAHQRLFMSSEDGEPPKKLAAEFVPGAASNEPAIEIDAKYPIPLPSPILLGGAMVLGIASIGSIFELTGVNPPPLGFAPTLGIVAVGLPTCLYLFYASILKAQAETEEDDKKFLGS
mmetsp:Transcript_29983/g.49506  ORF Transcript_29983/g.49506 Transcript_29983/m.49506 type:complete len:152 (+) Transcript_29983:59-514(+)